MTLVPSPEQQRVIDYPLLPLRVTAGAGTGKTTTMALRLVARIKHDRLEPEAALGITFTNKAAEELADKLREHIREQLPELDGAGREVEVTTYHGFAYSLLTEFGPLLGLKRNPRVITPGYARQLLREALGAGPRAALDLTWPPARVDELEGLAGRLGDHLVVPDDLLGQPTGDKDVAGKRAEMADALNAYRRRKADLGLIDYADMVALAHRLLSEYPELAAQVRHRYRVVLLDEYQDTNPAQRELLRLIFGDGFPVTAVGDPDQTIYEWRGASLENFAAFPKHFPREDGAEAETLPLSYNRRSARRIVDLANLVRQQIGRRSGLDRLQALPDAPPGDVETGWFHDACEEADWIARRVFDLHEAGEAAWRDMGILFRRHRDIGRVRQALERQGIPVEVASLGGLLDVPEVADLHAWLRIVGRPDDDAALVRLLLGSRYRLGLGDLAPLAAWRAVDPLADGDDAAPAARTMLEAFDHLEDCPGLPPDARRRLDGFRSTYRRLLAAAQGMSLVELCRTVLQETGAWPEVEALDDAARLSARLNLYRFLDVAEAWSPLEGAPSLDAFLDYLDLLTREGATDELDTAQLSGEDAVVLLTVHRAKGLEWPTVILPALCKGAFPVRAGTLEDPLTHPQFLPHHLRLDRDWLPVLADDPGERKELFGRLHDDAEWRTAYVAVTRAKRRLVLTGSFWYSLKRPRERSPLFDLATADGATVLFETTEAGLPPDTLRSDPPTGSPDPFFASGWRLALRAALANPALPPQMAAAAGATKAYEAALSSLNEVLAGLPEPPPAPATAPAFRTTVTSLVTFASCPLRFHWSAVDRLPRRPSPSRQHGVDVHRRIEQHHRGGLVLEEAGESAYDLPAADGPHGPDPFQVFRASRFAAAVPLLVEAPFELRLGEARLAVRIDAVYLPEPGTWEVVDFKSGVRRADPALRVQLEAYAVAVAEAGFPDPPGRTRVTFAYLGGGALEEDTEEVTEAWRGEAREHLAALLAAAAAGERTPVPSAACRTCDFARFCDQGAAWVKGGPA